MTNEKLGLLSIIALLIRYFSFLRAFDGDDPRAVLESIEDDGVKVVADDVVHVTDFSLSDCTKSCVDRTWVNRGDPRQDSFSIVSFNGSVTETLIVAGALVDVGPCTWILVTSFLNSVCSRIEGESETMPATTR